MADKVAAGHVGGANGAREAVCIHTKKIYSSCRDKDCIEDLRFYPTATAQSVLSTAQGLRGGSAELIYTFVDVEPVNFNRGYYTVDMHFFYRITLQALNGSTRYTEIEGLATFDKRVVLFGSESGAKIYSSIPEANAIDAPLNLTANLPTAVVEVVDPMLLCAHFADNCNCRCGCDRGTLGGVPAGILAAFDEPIIFDESAIRRVCISLGQFSTVRLERDTQLLIPVYDYCIPSNECTLAGGDCSCEDPCKVFDAVEVPMARGGARRLRLRVPLRRTVKIKREKTGNFPVFSFARNGTNRHKRVHRLIDWTNTKEGKWERWIVWNGSIATNNRASFYRTGSKVSPCRCRTSRKSASRSCAFA